MQNTISTQNATQNIICLLGPTASGKTNLALQLAQYLPLEIINVDSALIYRTMDIGTAKPAPDILHNIPHHLIDIRDPAESYSAADFCQDAATAITQIISQQKMPLLVGGTMLYYRSLWQGLAPLPPANAAIRSAIDARAAQIGWQALHQELQLIDPLSAARIHPNDPQRLQRALEVHAITGQPLSHFLELPAATAPYRTLKLAIAPSQREMLHQRIAERFDLMLATGFIDEVQQLYHRGDLSFALPSMRAVGYRQVWEYLEGKYDYATMRDKAIVATRQLAKRQITWLRSFANIIWLESEDAEVTQKALKHIQLFLDEKMRNSLGSVD